MKHILHILSNAADDMRPLAAKHLAISLALIFLSLVVALVQYGNSPYFVCMKETILTNAFVSLVLAFAFTLVIDLSIREQEQKKR